MPLASGHCARSVQDIFRLLPALRSDRSEPIGATIQYPLGGRPMWVKIPPSAPERL
jgi:hypothetical protein